MKRTQSGFTLVEFLVTVSIIALLVGLILPAVHGAREAVRRAHCQSNLRQVGIALTQYVDARGVFPDAATLPVTDNPLQLPSLFDELGSYCEENREIFHCPSDSLPAEELRRLGQSESSARTFYEREGVSYEYPGLLLAGQKLPQIENFFDDSGKSVWIVYDLHDFHGPTGADGSRNFLYLDGHVESLRFTTN